MDTKWTVTLWFKLIIIYIEILILNIIGLICMDMVAHGEVFIECMTILTKMLVIGEEEH